MPNREWCFTIYKHADPEAYYEFIDRTREIGKKNLIGKDNQEFEMNAALHKKAEKYSVQNHGNGTMPASVLNRAKKMSLKRKQGEMDD